MWFFSPFDIKYQEGQFKVGECGDGILEDHSNAIGMIHASEDKESLSGAAEISSWNMQIGGTETCRIGEPEGQWPRADPLRLDRSFWVGGTKIKSEEKEKEFSSLCKEFFEVFVINSEKIFRELIRAGSVNTQKKK